MGGFAVAVVGGAELLSLVATLFLLLVLGTIWVFTRRRWARFGSALLLLALAGVVAAWVPPHAQSLHAQVTGSTTGEARFPVQGSADAPLVVDGGEGRLETTPEGRVEAVLSCPSRCTFRIGAEPAFRARPSVSISVDEPFRVTLDGGPFLAESVLTYCTRVPFALRPLQEGDGCMTCHETTYLSGRVANETTHLRGSRGPVC